MSCYVKTISFTAYKFASAHGGALIVSLLIVSGVKPKEAALSLVAERASSFIDASWQVKRGIQHCIGLCVSWSQ